MELKLKSTWKTGKQLGEGGFGKVYEAESGGKHAVAKLVPKAPGADRELLFVNPGGVRNVIPVIDEGETDDSYVLIMPKADKSLRQFLKEKSKLTEAETKTILHDLFEALTDMAGKITHRDIKPENILLLNGKWCLADFGISRYAEATTAPDTHKYSMTPAYNPPERWRNERASSKSDIYSVGIVAFELLTGKRPFPGPQPEDYREQHVSDRPPKLNGVTLALADLVDTMLFKAPDARPTAHQLSERLDPQGGGTPILVVEALQQANSAEIEKKTQESIEKAKAKDALDRRAQLQETAIQSFDRISLSLRDTITTSATTAQLAGNSTSTWFVRLGQATLEMPPLNLPMFDDWGDHNSPGIEVVATAEIILKAPSSVGGKTGRAHSLWFCDAQNSGQFEWYETGFMISPLMARSTQIEPFSLDPGDDAAKALLPMMAEVQVAWPFTPLTGENLNEFITRWATWFGMSANGYQPPTQMPERDPQGSWRRG